MATYIKIERAGNEIVVRNKQDADTNRLRNLERKEEEQTKAAIKAATAIATEEVKRRLRSLRDRPAASSVTQQNRLGHLWWFLKSEPITNYGVRATLLAGYNSPRIYAYEFTLGYRRTSRLYCGDGTKYIEIEHGHQPQQMLPTYQGFPYSEFADPPFTTPANVVLSDGRNGAGSDRADMLILPAGKDNFIAVFVSATNLTAITTNVPVLSETTTTVVNGITYRLAACGYPPQGDVYSPNPNSFYPRYLPILNFSKIEQNSIVKRVFICSNTNIREIVPPPAFASLLDVMYAETTENYTYETELVRANAKLVAISTRTKYNFVFPYLASGLSGINSIRNTPAVYNEACDLNRSGSYGEDVINAWRAQLGGLTKPIASTLRWLVEDLTKGAYAYPYINSSWNEIWNGPESFKYGQWNTPGAEPDYEYVNNTYYTFDAGKFRTQPSRDFRLSPNRLEVPAEFDNDGGYNNRPGLYTVWDWDDPSYCRQMLAALGFSPQDLTP